jgi:hypothetical protein
MAQSGFTPISIYYSSTASAVPLAANLAFGELALNILDGKLYFKNSTGVVTLLSSSAISGGSFTTLSYSTSFTGVGAATITDNSTNAALRVTQTGTGNALLVEDSTNPDSTPFVIDQNGVVVSGNTTPITATVSPRVQAQVTDSTAGFSSIRFSSDVSGIQNVLAKSRGTLGTNTIVANGDTIATLNFSGADGTNYIPAATIEAAVDGAPGTNDMPGRLVFSTTLDGASTPTERMRINNAGNVGIGNNASSTLISLNVPKPITGSTIAYGISSSGQVQSDVTTSAYYYLTSASTVSSVPVVRHYYALQGSFGGAVTTQAGFTVESTINGATNNYGFAGNIAAGTNRYNLYMAGTANNYMAGNLWLGTISPGSVTFANYLDLTGATQAFGTATSTIIRSSVTTSATNFYSLAATESAAFTLASLTHYSAAQSTFANTAVTSQTGFQAQSNMIGATNNYGFFGNIPAGTNRYNLYCGGTANNYMAGSLGIGNVPSSGQTLFLNQSITGNVNSTAVRQQGTVDLASVTATCYAFDNVASTTATAATLPTYIHYNSQQGTFGAGSTVTSQIGFASASTLIGATNNYGHYAADTAAVTTGKTAYGFYSLVNTASGGGTAYGFYAAGTAPNVFNNLGITSTLGYTTGSGGTVTQLTSRATAVTLNKASGQITMFTAAGSSTWATFTVNNSLVAATDTVVLSVNGATNSYVMTVSSIAAGAFIILFSSVSGTASDTPKINFTVIKGSIS